ncbi:2-oxoglutarate dehydrogenase, E2 component, dihydrolipoamide succinyltransferase [Streptomyces sp. JJ36]|uniref:2-oxoglutarate dehydrogenase, E2 component, dihydrolipoamide succinyltransferase n=1 Tax=Streptomyces sp. JJ36 TaxID=2736645 RepID=UPI001F001544|nr:2-oxoglutarate dehydrogenase, E2 component, dihydrolipoamide succinyltransferase [Streptomyces sp. JJ36]MCF6525812.1 2-oxoglutarate dehydrogenase, E2 component, dihydrolipoamide succinyltransferase [Streptomyces sp. JJ36]
MAVSVTLPALGESVSEGTVTRWLKAEGEHVEADEPLLEVSTDKVDTEIPAPASGTLSAIKVAEDETVEVGAELALIDDGSGGGAAAPAAEPAQQEAPAQQAPPAPQAEPAPQQAAPQQPAQPEPAAQAAPSGGGAEGTDVVLPALGESVSEGTVTRWLKQVGDTVEADEPLLEVSTDKVDTEIPAPSAGTLLEIVVGEDETAEVGAKLAVIGSGEAAPQAPAQPAPAQPEQPPREAAPAEAPAPAQPAQQAPPQAAPQQPAPAQAAPQPAPQQPAPQQAAPQEPAAPRPEPTPTAPAQPTTPRAGGAEFDGAYVTPLVRKLAAEHGVNLSEVKGTGVGGRIRKQDVVAAAEAAKAARPQAPAAPAARTTTPAEPSPLRGQTVKMPRIRKLIAENMMKALHSQAQLSTVVEVDVTRIMKLRARAKEAFVAREGVKLSPMPFFVQAAAEALKAHPAINAKINDDGTITYHDVENIGIAVDSEKGLMVPVIKEAGNLNLAGIARKTAELAKKVREGGLGPDDMSGGTFTISNTGSRGALFDTIIVNHPQVAELGIGATVRRPVVVDHPELGETIAIRDMVYLTLSYDHQLVDGADAARYLADVKARLEAGEFEGELGL